MVSHHVTALVTHDNYCDNYCVNECRRRILLQDHREWKSCCTCWQLSKSPAIPKKGRKGSQMLNNKLTIRLTLRVSTIHWACLRVCGLTSASCDCQPKVVPAAFCYCICARNCMVIRVFEGNNGPSLVTRREVSAFGSVMFATRHDCMQDCTDC